MRPERAPTTRLISIARFAIVSLVIGGGLLLVRLQGPPPLRRGLLLAIQVSGRVMPGVLGALILLGLGVATLVAIRRQGEQPRARPVREEPLLPLASLPGARGAAPLVALVGLDSGAGASSLAFNLAVLASSLGQPFNGVRPRTLCLLSDGHLTKRLGLDSGLLVDHLEVHAGRVTPDLVDLAQHHSSGCELLCVPVDFLATHQLRLLRRAVGPYYRAIIVDCAAADARLRTAGDEVADVVLYLTTASRRNNGDVTDAIGRMWALRRYGNRALVVNRLLASDRIDFEDSAIDFGAALPHDDEVQIADLTAVPWALSPTSPAGGELRALVQQILPDLLRTESSAVR
jgi:hypothetical protein